MPRRPSPDPFCLLFRPISVHLTQPISQQLTERVSQRLTQHRFRVLSCLVNRPPFSPTAEDLRLRRRTLKCRRCRVRLPHRPVAGRPRVLCGSCTFEVVLSAVHAHAASAPQARTTCLVCLGTLPASRRRKRCLRSDALTCGPACRHLLWRARRYISDGHSSSPEPSLEFLPASATSAGDELDEAAQRASQLAQIDRAEFHDAHTRFSDFLRSRPSLRPP